MKYKELKRKVHNRGSPPDAFLDELINWGRTGMLRTLVRQKPYGAIFVKIQNVLGKPQGELHSAAMMLEVMRVLAGFESSWKWKEGRDVTNKTSVTSTTIEAGAWQVSANSMDLPEAGEELKKFIKNEFGTLDGNVFQTKMKSDHCVAMEYIARLLLCTTRHNGPANRGEINRYLSNEAVAEFQALLGAKNSSTPHAAELGQRLAQMLQGATTQ
jgi:hypothetical protein